jgi:hypothetical protein
MWYRLYRTSHRLILFRSTRTGCPGAWVSYLERVLSVRAFSCLASI